MNYYTLCLKHSCTCDQNSLVLEKPKLHCKRSKIEMKVWIFVCWYESKHKCFCQYLALRTISHWYSEVAKERGRQSNIWRRWSSFENVFYHPRKVDISEVVFPVNCLGIKVKHIGLKIVLPSCHSQLLCVQVIETASEMWAYYKNYTDHEMVNFVDWQQD